MASTDPENLRREAIYRMTSAERFGTCCELYDFMHRLICQQVREEHPDWPDDEIRWQVARRMYLTDREAQKLLAVARESASYE